MVKCGLFVLVSFAFIEWLNALDTKEYCQTCVPMEECTAYGNLNKEDQLKWQERYECDEPSSPAKRSSIVPGFLSRAKGDRVCCPENVWGVEPGSTPSNQEESISDEEKNPDVNSRRGFNYPQNVNNYNNRNNQGSQHNNPNDYDDFGLRPNWDRNGGRSQNRRKKPKPNNNPYFLPSNRNENSFEDRSSGGQCPITSFPPDPDTGCCGLEASRNDKITNSQDTMNNPYNSNNRNNWMPQMNFPSSGMWPSWMPKFNRKKRENNVTVTVDNRIAGGKDTDLFQYPWTVLIKTTFAYPNKDASFSCGGSLISSKYILTAGHCLFDSNGDVKNIELNLAEYDKRSYPRDCKFSLDRGEVCVDNIVMQADGFTIHPEYDDTRLENDIALIRLRGNAPYTEFIRPICLPPLDVDSPELSNLKLAVAGWGRNGRYKSNIKQSTFVNLVPQRECRDSYPNLSRRQLCAAGYTGEDTCKGDSGGPLMMMYNGKYYVSGVVSGKRADAPCGTSVPSLYTNVYQYVSWIQNVIRN